MTRECRCPDCGRMIQVDMNRLRWTPTVRLAWCSVCGRYSIRLVHMVKIIQRDRPKNQSKKERLKLRKEKPCQK